MNIISIEGTDGTGKTTISKLLFQKLKENLSEKNIEIYKEPLFFKQEIFNTNIQNPSYLLFLFLTSRTKLIQNLKIGNKIIIMDRYIESTLVYQVLLQKIIDFETFLYLHQKIIFQNNNNFWPSLTFILEANTNDIKKRIKQKNNTKLFDNYEIQTIQNLYKMIPHILSNRIFYFFNTSEKNPYTIVDEMIQIIKNKIIIPSTITKTVNWENGI